MNIDGFWHFAPLVSERTRVRTQALEESGLSLRHIIISSLEDFLVSLCDADDSGGISGSAPHIIDIIVRASTTLLYRPDSSATGVGVLIVKPANNLVPLTSASHIPLLSLENRKPSRPANSMYANTVTIFEDSRIILYSYYYVISAGIGRLFVSVCPNVT